MDSGSYIASKFIPLSLLPCQASCVRACPLSHLSLQKCHIKRNRNSPWQRPHPCSSPVLPVHVASPTMLSASFVRASTMTTPPCPASSWVVRLTSSLLLIRQTLFPQDAYELWFVPSLHVHKAIVLTCN